MNRRIFLQTGLCLAVLPVAVASAQARPRVLIFPTTLGRLAVAAEQKTGIDGLTDGDRINLAARAVREQLEAENVVTTLLYDSSDTFFKKALSGAKVNLPAGAELDEAARLKLGAAVGAHYILTVYSRLAVDQVGTSTTAPLISPILEVESIEIKPGGKPGGRWQDKIPIAATSDGLRRSVGAIPPGVETSARTLVLRFLGGPLREFSRTALDPTLLPPPAKPKPAVVEGPPLDFDAEATRMMGEAQEQLHRDQPVAAIALLRQAVNYQPRRVAPRLLLAEAYQKAKRSSEATGEIRRAMKLATGATPEQKSDLTRLLARVLVEEGDQEGATQLFNQLLGENPNNTEARLGLAELLLTKGQNEAAEIQFRLIRDRDPASVEAGQGLVRLLSARGALDDAIKETKASLPAVQNPMATLIFIESATGLAARAVQNRAAWEEKKLSREVFFKATATQATRAKQLVDLLGGAAPAETASESVRLAHNRRVLAANLLAQSFSSLQEYLETGEAATGVRARTLLNEFYTEMKDAQSPKK
ncbi:MAG: tetratricopeptide repeat protein [Armatimonadetes bacterium]|nr:tetratricopeptide repeat protein [Armatimonadota bacterium]